MFASLNVVPEERERVRGCFVNSHIRLQQSPFSDARRADLSEEGKARLLSIVGEPLFYSDWLRPVFIHYEVDPGMLQRSVPFELDLREGRAYVSLVAFTMRGLRPAWGGRWTAWLFAPIATHGLLNVRTYVRHRGEPGIYFLTEWIPNRMSVWLGPRTFGLPYRLGRLDYRHRHETGRLSGTVGAREGRFSYSAEFAAQELNHCAQGSLDEFLIERYTAFTSCGSRRRFFRIWHPPWLQTKIEARVEDCSLLAASFNWFRGARQVGANYSPEAECVWMGRPHGLSHKEPAGLTSASSSIGVDKVAPAHRRAF